MQGKMEELKIPIFDGKDYECWKRRIIMILKMKKCIEVIERRKVAADKEDEWGEKDLKAINYIYSGVTNDQLQYIKDKETAFDIIKKFDEMYIRESTALQICIRNKLEKLKLKDFEDTTTFFNEFEKVVNELKSAGASVSEKEKLSYMIKMLPSSLSYIGDLVDVLKERDRTVEYVKNKIRMLEVRETEENPKGGSSVFRSEKKQDQACFKCGKFGHFKANCTSTKTRGNNSWRSRGGIQQGGGYQHWKNQGSNNSSRGSRGYSQYRRGGSWQKENYKPDDGNTSSFCAQIETCNVVANSCIDTVDWLLDSGCSDHIVNNEIVCGFIDTLDHKQARQRSLQHNRAIKYFKDKLCRST